MSGGSRFASMVTSFLRPTLGSLIGFTCPSLPNPGGLFNIAVRYNIRNHFPRPSERKRIKRHGWKQRMSTPGGQRILMRRMLKGKHVFTH